MTGEPTATITTILAGGSADREQSALLLACAQAVADCRPPLPASLLACGMQLIGSLAVVCACQARRPLFALNPCDGADDRARQAGFLLGRLMHLQELLVEVDGYCVPVAAAGLLRASVWYAPALALLEWLPTADARRLALFVTAAHQVEAERRDPAAAHGWHAAAAAILPDRPTRADHLQLEAIRTLVAERFRRPGELPAPVFCSRSEF